MPPAKLKVANRAYAFGFLWKLKNAIELPNDFVAFARGTFEFPGIKNFQSSAAVFDDLFSLQNLCRQADTGPIGPQHGREKIMGDGKRTGIHAIGGHQ
jgi:hypothetical protein